MATVAVEVGTCSLVRFETFDELRAMSNMTYLCWVHVEQSVCAWCGAMCEQCLEVGEDWIAVVDVKKHEGRAT